MKTLLLTILFISCTKEEPDFMLKMNFQTYFLTPELKGERGCPGTRDYQISAYNGDQFFKINWTTDTLRTGSYQGSFWYTNEGHSYSTLVRIEVKDFTQGILKASWKGGITEGFVNRKLIEL